MRLYSESCSLGTVKIVPNFVSKCQEQLKKLLLVISFIIFMHSQSNLFDFERRVCR
jgi:hypothetical protein